MAMWFRWGKKNSVSIYCNKIRLFIVMCVAVHFVLGHETLLDIKVSVVVRCSAVIRRYSFIFCHDICDRAQSRSCFKASTLVR